MKQWIQQLSIGGLIIIVVWWLASTVSPERLVPSPVNVFRQMVEDFPFYWKLLIVTSEEALFGLLIAASIAIGITVLAILCPRLENVLYPQFVLLKATPAVVFGPLLVAVMGIGLPSKALMAALISFFPLVVAGIDGDKIVPETLTLLGAGYGATSWTTLKILRIGYVSRSFASGLKTAAPLAVVGAIVGEYVISGNPMGIGQKLMESSASLQTVEVFACMVIASVSGIVFFLMVQFLANLLDWRLHLGK